MAKFKTKGAILKIGAANPPTTALSQLGDFTYDNGERDSLINATTHDTSSGVHEYLDPGFKSAPSISGEFLYDPANAVHEVVRAAATSGATLYALLILPDDGDAEFLFPVRVASCSIGLPVMGKLAMTIKLEGLAAETFTA